MRAVDRGDHRHGLGTRGASAASARRARSAGGARSIDERQATASARPTASVAGVRAVRHRRAVGGGPGEREALHADPRGAPDRSGKAESVDVSDSVTSLGCASVNSKTAWSWRPSEFGDTSLESAVNDSTLWLIVTGAVACAVRPSSVACGRAGSCSCPRPGPLPANENDCAPAVFVCVDNVAVTPVESTRSAVTVAAALSVYETVVCRNGDPVQRRRRSTRASVSVSAGACRRSRRPRRAPSLRPRSSTCTRRRRRERGVPRPDHVGADARPGGDGRARRVRDGDRPRQRTT